MQEWSPISQLVHSGGEEINSHLKKGRCVIKTVVKETTDEVTSGDRLFNSVDCGIKL